VTEADHFVHVSGHPARDELVRMYQMIRPRIAIPVHGEARHLAAHAELARTCQVYEALVIQNGDMIRLGGGAAAIVDEVPVGRIAQDGKSLVPLSGGVLQQRRRAGRDGSVVASLVVDRRGWLAAPPQITLIGLAEANEAPATLLRDALSDAISSAARPVLIAGLETGPDDAKWLRALAESVPAPVLTTPKGKGALPDPHPLALGLLAAGHPLLAQSDLLIAVGVDPVEVGPGVWPAGVRVASITRRAGDATVVGEIALVIEELAPRLRGRTRADWDVAALDRLKRGLRVAAPAGPGLARRRVVELAREMTPAGTLLTLDVPLTAAWQSVAPRECLVANGAATLGFALPAALAAALARPDARVVAVGAAAGFAAMAGEWRTAARLRAPSVAVALNHAGTTDVASGARAAGVDVETATDEASFRAAFDRAWRADAACLVDAHVSR